MSSQGAPDPAIVKIYFRIGEVASIIGLEPSVIRYWESEFRWWLRPTRSRSGQRMYTQNDIRKIRQIKRLLYEQRLTIEGAKKFLREGGSAAAGAEEVQGPKVTEPQTPTSEAPAVHRVLVELQKEAKDFLAWLEAQAAP